MSVLEAALRAHDAGVVVIPVKSDGTKKPPFLWGHFRTEPPDREQVQQWFSSDGYSGYAALCGAASGNLECLDFDDANTYQTFLDTGEAIGLGDLLTWMRWGYEERTPDGGAHLLYRCSVIDKHQDLARRPVPDQKQPDVLIETRSEGNYAILAPSNGTVHKTGRSWRLVSGGIDGIPEISPEDRAQLFALARSFDEMPPEDTQETSTDRATPDGSNRPGDDFRTRHGTLDAFRSIVEPHGWVLTHRRGDVGYFRRPGKSDSWSATFGHGGFDYFYVFSSSTDFEPERGYNPFSVYAHLNHGGDWKAAARELGQRGYGEQVARITVKHTATGGGGTAGPGTAERTTDKPHPAFPLTDMGNAERLAWDHGVDVRFCHIWNKWLVWDGMRFAIDDCGAIEARAKTTVRMIYKEAAQENDDKQREAIVKHAKASENAARVRAMVDLARSEPDIPVRPGELDLDLWTLNCANGTLDLRTATLRDHDRSDRLTKIVTAPYLPDARCPRFLAYLEQIMGGDAELVGFLQRAIGYSLTGSTVERVIFILHGSGKNGKSTLVEVLSALLGDYALRTPTETLLAKREQGIPNDIARLQHRRFVYASEAEEGQRLAEAKIKDMTGGDTITARFLHGEFFDFAPTFKLWFSTNHKPTIRGTDMAIWDRIRLIPFLVRIPPEDQDKRLRDKLIAEAPGILAWAVQGCLDWQRDGLREPDCVLNATRDYRSEMDVLGGFIADRCVVLPSAQVTSKDLYKAYTEWCEQNGEKALSQISVGKKLIERGFDSARMGHAMARTWLGIGLRSATP